MTNINKHLILYELLSEYYFEYDYLKGILSVTFPKKLNIGNEPDTRTYELKSNTPKGSQEINWERIARIINAKNDCVKEIKLNDVTHNKLEWWKIALKTLKDSDGKVVSAVGRLININSDKCEMERLKKCATLDSLTSVLNAATVRDKITESLAAMIPERRGALLMIDVDKFKDINDIYGHLSGDRVLISVAEVLKKSTSKTDIVGRPGGDEFLVYYPCLEGGYNALKKICEAILTDINAIDIEGGHECVTVSIGAALTREGDMYDVIYRHVDRALYSVKNSGRNAYKICGEKFKNYLL